MKIFFLFVLIIMAGGCGSLQAGTKWLKYESDKLKEEQRQADFQLRADRWALTWLKTWGPIIVASLVGMGATGKLGHRKGRRDAMIRSLGIEKKSEKPTGGQDGS